MPTKANRSPSQTLAILEALIRSRGKNTSEAPKILKQRYDNDYFRCSCNNRYMHQYYCGCACHIFKKEPNVNYTDRPRIKFVTGH